MATHVMKRGDTAPSLVATLTALDADTNTVQPVDLSTATSIRAVGVQNGSVLVDRTVTGTSAGVVELDWQAGDTDAVGYVHFEFIVTWSDGTVQTFPEDGDVRVRIALDGA